jgi:transcriptional regulator with XRE-family HTH domain
VTDELRGDDERPAWAARIRAERTARGWSQTEAVRALRVHANEALPGAGSLLRNWKRWEAGEVEPDDFYKRLIAKTFGTVTGAFFPRPAHRNADVELLAGTGMDTLEIIARLRMSDVSQATLDGLRITADRLCCEYPYMSAEQLRIEGQTWLRRITGILDRRLTLAQHQEVLILGGWVALLLGCVEYDMGWRPQAEATRQAALSLGQEAGNVEILGWAHEMRAWYALTQGDYRGVIVAADTGEALAPHHPVSVQLSAQRAKAWARLGDRRQVELALEHGRALLEQLPYPEDLDNHFSVDPSKFDYYAMDCYRLLGEDRRAEIYAREVLRYSVSPDGRDHQPMRTAEARITLGVAAARAGDVEAAVALGRQALGGERKSLPSLLNVSRELKNLLQERHPKAKEAAAYVDELRALMA